MKVNFYSKTVHQFLLSSESSSYKQDKNDE